MSQFVIPFSIAVITVFLWQRKLVGVDSRWLAYPLTLITAGLIAALIAIGQFWMPQIEMGLATKGLPPIVFLIVGSRLAVPALAYTFVLLVGLACIKLWRQTRAS